MRPQPTLYQACPEFRIQFDCFKAFAETGELARAAKAWEQAVIAAKLWRMVQAVGRPD